MKVVIMGCSRVGAHLAGILDSEGHNVSILDIDTYSFRRLPPAYGGEAYTGSGTDEDALIQAGIREANLFVAATQGDNRNIMAAQIAKHIFHVPRAVCRIYDPIRQEMYQELGLESVSPTILVADAMRKVIGG
ncbi:MAG: TrkA family potassium uptake protein [Dehalococcoidia bacterium]